MLQEPHEGWELYHDSPGGQNADGSFWHTVSAKNSAGNVTMHIYGTPPFPAPESQGAAAYPAMSQAGQLREQYEPQIFNALMTAANQMAPGWRGWGILINRIGDMMSTASVIVIDRTIYDGWVGGDLSKQICNTAADWMIASNRAGLTPWTGMLLTVSSEKHSFQADFSYEPDCGKYSIAKDKPQLLTLKNAVIGLID